MFTGPYMVENDSSGEMTGYSPGKEIKLVRNPSWDADTDWRPAYVDSITVQEGFADPTSASKKILDGSASVSGDFPPSPTVVQQVAQGDQVRPEPDEGDAVRRQPLHRAEHGRSRRSTTSTSARR